MEQASEKEIKILFYAGVASLIVGYFNDTDYYRYLEGFSIISACLFIVTLSALCDWGKNKQYKILHDAIRDEKIAVIRGNKGLSET